MRHEFSKKPEKCPACGSPRVADILFGLPAYSEELQADLDAGRVTLGGCCISGSDPEWECADCGVEIFRKEPDEK